MLFTGPSIISVLFFVINITLTFTIIFLERKTPQSTYAWLLFLWIIPVLGFLFYLFFSQNLTKNKIFKHSTPEILNYHEILKKQRQSLGRMPIIDPDNPLERYRETIQFHLNVSDSLYTSNNSVEIFTDGQQKFDSLFDAMESAKEHIHVEYYIIKNDSLAIKMMDILTRKALEGLEVRLLFDAMGGRYISRQILNGFISAGGKVGIFFPSRFKWLNIRINYRNHRKIAIIDGKIGFLGGFNVGNEYLGKDAKMGYWRDTHLKIVGSATNELQLRFLMDWRASSSEELLIDEDNLSAYLPPLLPRNGAGIQIVSSGPDNINQQIKQGFLRLINDAESYVLIQSPYFVPDESIMEALRIALLSNIDVRIMIPNKPDHIFIYWATLAYVGELIDYGARIYIYDKGFLHAKTIVVDDAVSSVGSCNFDIRSFALNFETNAFVYDKEIAIKLRKIFVADMENCIYYDRNLYLNRNRSVKIKEAVSRLFSPLL